MLMFVDGLITLVQEVGVITVAGQFYWIPGARVIRRNNTALFIERSPEVQLFCIWSIDLLNCHLTLLIMDLVTQLNTRRRRCGTVRTSSSAKLALLVE